MNPNSYFKLGEWRVPRPKLGMRLGAFGFGPQPTKLPTQSSQPWYRQNPKLLSSAILGKTDAASYNTWLDVVGSTLPKLSQSEFTDAQIFARSVSASITPISVEEHNKSIAAYGSVTGQTGNPLEHAARTPAQLAAEGVIWNRKSLATVLPKYRVNPLTKEYLWLSPDMFLEKSTTKPTELATAETLPESQRTSAQTAAEGVQWAAATATALPNKYRYYEPTGEYFYLSPNMYLMRLPAKPADLLAAEGGPTSGRSSAQTAAEGVLWGQAIPTVMSKYRFYLPTKEWFWLDANMFLQRSTTRPTELATAENMPDAQRTAEQTSIEGRLWAAAKPTSLPKYRIYEPTGEYFYLSDNQFLRRLPAKPSELVSQEGLLSRPQSQLDAEKALWDNAAWMVLSKYRFNKATGEYYYLTPDSYLMKLAVKPNDLITAEGFLSASRTPDQITAEGVMWSRATPTAMPKYRFYEPTGEYFYLTLDSYLMRLPAKPNELTAQEALVNRPQSQLDAEKALWDNAAWMVLSKYRFNKATGEYYYLTPDMYLMKLSAKPADLTAAELLPPGERTAEQLEQEGVMWARATPTAMPKYRLYEPTGEYFYLTLDSYLMRLPAKPEELTAFESTAAERTARTPEQLAAEGLLWQNAGLTVLPKYRFNIATGEYYYLIDNFLYKLAVRPSDLDDAERLPPASRTPEQVANEGLMWAAAVPTAMPKYRAYAPTGEYLYLNPEMFLMRLPAKPDELAAFEAAQVIAPSAPVVEPPAVPTSGGPSASEIAAAAAAAAALAYAATHGGQAATPGTPGTPGPVGPAIVRFQLKTWHYVAGGSALVLIGLMFMAMRKKSRR